MTVSIHWFRRDLRLADNPAFQAAVQGSERLIPVYIHDPEAEGDWAGGAASRWWLHHSLQALDAQLRALGSRLIVRRGPVLEALRGLASETGARTVHWNRLYEPAVRTRDARVKHTLREEEIAAHSHNASLLFEPWTVSTGDGSPYRVFTPYWNACQRLGLPLAAKSTSDDLPGLPADIDSLPLEALRLMPRIRWDQGLHDHWQPGEAGAQQRLKTFLNEAIRSYGDERDRPDLQATSRLSPHLHFGEIGPRQIVTAAQACTAVDSRGGTVAGQESFLRELGWREFSHHLLYHFPQTPEASLDGRFEHFPWRADYRQTLQAWHRGLTGIPLVDAGMRELWHTGWMHNRVRMVAASFLTKNLLIPWQEGARWFWDTLLDADLANNTQGWQWTAGCGADAAPYFRVFNPVLQSRKFDPEGRYLRRWLPELSAIPTRHLHAPWEASEEVLTQAGVRLGTDYPAPIVDLAASRKHALAAYAAIKRG